MFLFEHLQQVATTLTLALLICSAGVIQQPTNVSQAKERGQEATVEEEACQLQTCHNYRLRKIISGLLAVAEAAVEAVASEALARENSARSWCPVSLPTEEEEEEQEEQEEEEAASCRVR